MSKTTRVRKNFRLPEEMVKWGEEFAQSHKMSLTDLVVEGLILLRERELRKELRRGATAAVSR